MKNSWGAKVPNPSFLPLPTMIVLILQNLPQLPKIHFILARGEVSIKDLESSRGQWSSVSWATKKSCPAKGLPGGVEVSSEATGFITDLWVVVFSHVFAVGMIKSGEMGQENGSLIPSATVTVAKFCQLEFWSVPTTSCYAAVFGYRQG